MANEPSEPNEPGGPDLSPQDESLRAQRELDQAERWMGEDTGDRRAVVWALGVALVIHAAVLFARMPDLGPDLKRVDLPKETAMKMQFLEPPPPAPAPKPPEPQPPKPETKKIPRPDPTPDDPEPVVEPEPPVVEPEVDSEPVQQPVTSGPTSPNPAPVAPAQMGPVRVSPGQGPGLIKKVEPVYPPIARTRRLEGTVVLDAVILANGTVGEVTVVSSANPMFERSAIDAMKQWRFTPGKQDVIMTLTVHFQLR